MLNKLSAGLAAITAGVHIIVGGADALTPTLAAGLSAPAKGAMEAVWHMTSLLLLWSVLVFWRGGKLAKHFGVFWILFALIFIYVGLKQGGVNGLIINPQWTILGLTGVLAFIGNRHAH